MRYGRIDMSVPDFSKEIDTELKEIEALNDLLSKEQITKEEFTKREKKHKEKIEGYKRYCLAYIVATNGGYTPKKPKNKQHKGSDLNLSEYKDMVMSERKAVYADEFEKKISQQDSETEPGTPTTE